MGFYKVEGYTARGSIGYLVRRASNLMSARVEAVFAKHEITFVQWLVLLQLRDDLVHTGAELCRDMCHDSGALTRVIDQLEQRGFLTRQRSLGDRRIVTLHLTDEGRRVVESLVPVTVNLLNRAVAKFTDEEVTTLTSLLTRLVGDVTEIPVESPLQLESAS
jgi:DNA-binding MarR family transcriptional regulator